MTNIWTIKESEKPWTRKDIYKYLTNYFKTISLDNNLAMSNKVEDAYAYSAAILLLGINLTDSQIYIQKMCINIFFAVLCFRQHIIVVMRKDSDCLSLYPS